MRKIMNILILSICIVLYMGKFLRQTLTNTANSFAGAGAINSGIGAAVANSFAFSNNINAGNNIVTTVNI
jgi:hypothetical protein